MVFNVTSREAFLKRRRCASDDGGTHVHTDLLFIEPHSTASVSVLGLHRGHATDQTYRRLSFVCCLG